MWSRAPALCVKDLDTVEYEVEGELELGLFNAIRILALGVAMGHLYRKLVTTDRRERLQNGTYA